MNKKEAIRNIKDYAELKEGWTSYSSHIIQGNSIINSVKFIKSLPDDIVEEMFSVPTASGGVTLSWEGEELQIEFCDGKIEVFLNEEDVSVDRARFLLDIFLKEKIS